MFEGGPVAGVISSRTYGKGVAFKNAWAIRPPQ